MPMIMTADGIQHIRSMDASGRVTSFTEINEIWNANITLNYKTFNLYIENMEGIEEMHMIDITNNCINLGDNIVVNVASDHPYVTAKVFNISEGNCVLSIVNDRDTDDEIELTITIIN